jgi:hypothetical protein
MVTTTTTGIEVIRDLVALQAALLDIHARSQEPAVFDAWRLETYIASLGRRGVKIIDRACGTSGGSLRDKIALWLKHLEEGKSIVRLDGAYVLHDAERKHDDPEGDV